MDHQSNEKEPKRSNAHAFLQYSSLGLQLFISIGIFGWLGYLIDQRLGIKFPAFLLLFILLALIGGIYRIYRKLPN